MIIQVPFQAPLPVLAESMASPLILLAARQMGQENVLHPKKLYYQSIINRNLVKNTLILVHIRVCELIMNVITKRFK